MPHDASQKFPSLWQNACRENPPNPNGAVGELMSALGDVLDVEIVEYGQVASAGLFLLELSSLGFKGMDLNVIMVTHPNTSDEEARLHAHLITEYKDAVQSIGFCFHIALCEEPQPNLYVPSSLEAVYVCGLDLERLFNAQVPSAALFDIIRRQIGLRELCPFNTTREARGAMFKGRASELRSLVNDMDNQFLVTGARRIGKTSLLKRAQSVLNSKRETRNRSFYFDCYTWSDYWDCAHRLVQKVLPKGDLRLELGSRNLFHLLHRESAGGKRPFILFFDECDRLVDHEKSSDWPFFSFLQEAMDYNYIRVTFAGFRSVQEISRSKYSPFFGAIKDIRTQPLSNSEVKNLLADPFSTMGIPFIDANHILEKVHKRSGGHPFLVQFYGERLFDKAMGKSPQQVYPENVDEIENDFELTNFLKSHFLWNTMNSVTPSLSERLCAVIYALYGKYEPWTERDFLDACHSHSETSICLDDVQKAVTNLYYSCILGFSKDRYSFTFPLLRDTIVQLYPTVESLLNDLERR